MKPWCLKLGLKTPQEAIGKDIQLVGEMEKNLRCGKRFQTEFLARRNKTFINCQR